MEQQLTPAQAEQIGGYLLLGILVLFCLIGGISTLMSWWEDRHAPDGTDAGEAGGAAAGTEIVAARIDPPPAPAAHPRVLPMATWWPIVTAQAVHVRLIGPTSSGKSIMAQALASYFPGQLVILDPVAGPDAWGGLPVITTDDELSYAPLRQACDALLKEMKRRVRERRVSGAVPERLTILFDEVPDTVTELPDTAGVFIRRMAQRGRHSAMHLIGMAQSERVRSWGLEGYGDAAESFATVYLGAKAIERLPWVADVQQFPAVLEWRGKLTAIDTTGLLELAARPIDPARAFRLSGLCAEEEPVKIHQETPIPLEQTDTDRSEGAPVGSSDTVELYRELRAKGWGRDRARKAGIKVDNNLWSKAAV